MARQNLETLTSEGVAVWLDTLSRELLEDGLFGAMVDDWEVTGTTSNPSIFEKAICGSERYDDQIAAALAAGVTAPKELFLELALEDVRRAAAELRGVYEATDGADGFASLQCTPDLADDADATIAQALELWRRLDAPNAMIKVAATDAGILAIEELTAAGVNVNVTLLFAVERYEQAIEAYLRGLERRVERRQSLAGIRSVGSFFVSRIDAKIDARLPADSPLRGEVAVANARRAYALFQDRFSSPRWHALAAHGAVAQRPLWASTATKDPAYRDVVYLEQLALRRSILTVPEATLRAFADHGDVARARPLDGEAERVLAALGEGLLDRVTATLEREGVDAFTTAYRSVLGCVEARVHIVRRGRELGAAA